MSHASRSCATHVECAPCRYTQGLLEEGAFCPGCGKCLRVVYDYDAAAYYIRCNDQPTNNIWAYQELLPILNRESIAQVGQNTGYTPLVRAKRLGKELGIKNLWIKDDSLSRPSLSYKDRVVAMAVGRILDLGLGRIGCVSTGNVGNAVAAMAAHAGIDAFVLYPQNIEEGKVSIAMAYGAYVCQVTGNYDQLNRLVRPAAVGAGLKLANVDLRPFYSEGAKTVGWEIVDQMHTKPDHIVLPAAGGTLASRVHQGLDELDIIYGLGLNEIVLHVAQPAGCSPIATAIQVGDSLPKECIPNTKAYSLAIGKPGDGHLVIDAVQKRGGSSAIVTDEEIFEAIDLLARTEGIFTEPAGGATIAGLAQLAQGQHFAPNDSVVAVITGNGLKTIANHPVKPWPVTDCESEAMFRWMDGVKLIADHMSAAA